MKTIVAKRGNVEYLVKISEVHYHLVCGKKWYLDKDGYAIARGERRGTTIKMHRLMIGAKTGEEIDHTNRNKLDNRIENLRIVSHHENCLNRIRGTGVRFDRDRNKWRARLTFKNQEIHLGRFDTREEALNARLEGAIKYFGKEYAI